MSSGCRGVHVSSGHSHSSSTQLSRHEENTNSIGALGLNTVDVVIVSAAGGLAIAMIVCIIYLSCCGFVCKCDRKNCRATMYTPVQIPDRSGPRYSIGSIEDMIAGSSKVTLKRKVSIIYTSYSDLTAVDERDEICGNGVVNVDKDMDTFVENEEEEIIFTINNNNTKASGVASI